MEPRESPRGLHGHGFTSNSRCIRSRGGGGVVELDQTGFTKGAVLALLHSGKGAVEEGLEEVLGLAEGLPLGGAQAFVLRD